jgi:hypothetical protein
MPAGDGTYPWSADASSQFANRPRPGENLARLFVDKPSSVEFEPQPPNMRRATDGPADDNARPNRRSLAGRAAMDKAKAGTLCLLMQPLQAKQADGVSERNSEVPGYFSTDAAGDGQDVHLCGAIPGVALEVRDPGESTHTRAGILFRKRLIDGQREDLFRETRRLAPDTREKNLAYSQIRECMDESRRLEGMLEESFLPQHGLDQLIGPRAFFVSPLFRVGSKGSVRAKHVELVLQHRDGKPVIQYRGPEVRQSDALVFAALLHMLRDVRLGTLASFRPDDVCKVLFGRYDGNTRRQLREHILRLQGGVVVFESFSVQLCLRFDFPRIGRWTVALDQNIVSVFKVSSEVWLSLKVRLELPEGLATWLYGYVRSQTKLIPTKLETLRQACGSAASPKAFMNGMRAALRELARLGIVDKGWSLGGGAVRWMKAHGQ